MHLGKEEAESLALSFDEAIVAPTTTVNEYAVFIVSENRFASEADITKGE